MDLSSKAAVEDPFSVESIFSHQDLPVVPNAPPDAYCRLCLTTPDVEPLFPPSGQPNIYVLELIGKYIGIGITMQDDFQCAVCNPCQLILDQFDMFRQNCLKVDIAIRRKRLGMDRVAVKAEPVADDDDNEEADMPFVRLENRNYQCRLCSEVFRSMALFMHHCKEEHPEESKMYKCKLCSKAFLTKTARLQHIRSHRPNNSIDTEYTERLQVCEKCMITFQSYKDLKKHLKDSHAEDPRQESPLLCGTCSKQFSRITILRNHILRVHMGRLPHVCKKCGISFGYAQQLTTHLASEHGIVLSAMLDQTGAGEDEPDVDEEQASTSTVHPQDFVQVKQELPDIDQPQPEEAHTSAQAKHSQQQHHDAGTHRLPPAPVSHAVDASVAAPSTQQQYVAPAAKGQPKTPYDLSEPSSGQKKNIYKCIDCNIECATQEDVRSHRKIHQDPTWWKCVHCRNFVKHQKMHLMKKHPTIDADRMMEESFQLRFRCWMCRVYFKSLPQMEQHAVASHRIVLPASSSTAAMHDAENPQHEQEQQQPLSLQAAIPSAPPLQQQQQSAISQSNRSPQKGSSRSMAMSSHHPAASSGGGTSDHPLLLSQLENGAWNYLKELNRFIDPSNLYAFVEKIKEEPELMDTSIRALNLSTGGQRKDFPKVKKENVSDGEEDDDADGGEDGGKYGQHQDGGEDSDLSQDDTYLRLANRAYQCKFCPAVFRHLLLIRKHTKADHPGEWKSFKCKDCKRRFPSAAVRDRHAHFHSLSHPFKCSDCDQMYDTRKHLEQHQTTYHDIQSAAFTAERMRCGTCNLVFTEKKYYDLHSRIYHQRRPTRLKNLTDKLQVCERCVIKFDSKEELAEHIREKHHADPVSKSCICTKCSKDLKTLTLLRVHILVVHLGQLPFVCQHCEAGFASRHWLLKHVEKEHTEMAVLKCTECEESFTDEVKLTEHVEAVHTVPTVTIDPTSGAQIFPCTKCDKQLDSKVDLEKHIEKAHPAFMLLYKCPLCTKPIRYRKQHMRVHHDLEYNAKEHPYQVRYKCHCCSKLFLQKRNLVGHLKAFAFACVSCMMRFKSKKALQKHTATTHRVARSVLKCSDCGLEFGYRGRLLEHQRRFHSPTSTEKLNIVSCPYCPKLFMSLSNRERHISATHPQADCAINCGHCTNELQNTAALRKHYRSEHPNERVTFRCPAVGCDRTYLNLSSYKDHHRKHLRESADGTAVAMSTPVKEHPVEGVVESPTSPIAAAALEARAATGEPIIKSEMDSTLLMNGETLPSSVKVEPLSTDEIKVENETTQTLDTPSDKPGLPPDDTANAAGSSASNTTNIQSQSIEANSELKKEDDNEEADTNKKDVTKCDDVVEEEKKIEHTMTGVVAGAPSLETASEEATAPPAEEALSNAPAAAEEQSAAQPPTEAKPSTRKRPLRSSKPPRRPVAPTRPPSARQRRRERASIIDEILDSYDPSKDTIELDDDDEESATVEPPPVRMKLDRKRPKSRGPSAGAGANKRKLAQETAGENPKVEDVVDVQQSIEKKVKCDETILPQQSSTSESTTQVPHKDDDAPVATGAACIPEPSPPQSPPMQPSMEAAAGSKVEPMNTSCEATVEDTATTTASIVTADGPSKVEENIIGDPSPPPASPKEPQKKDQANEQTSLKICEENVNKRAAAAEVEKETAEAANESTEQPSLVQKQHSEQAIKLEECSVKNEEAAAVEAAIQEAGNSVEPEKEESAEEVSSVEEPMGKEESPVPTPLEFDIISDTETNNVEKLTISESSEDDSDMKPRTTATPPSTAATRSTENNQPNEHCRSVQSPATSSSPLALSSASPTPTEAPSEEAAKSDDNNETTEVDVADDEVASTSAAAADSKHSPKLVILLTPLEENMTREAIAALESQADQTTTTATSTDDDEENVTTSSTEQIKTTVTATTEEVPGSSNTSSSEEHQRLQQQLHEDMEPLVISDTEEAEAEAGASCSSSRTPPLSSASGDADAATAKGSRSGTDPLAGRRGLRRASTHKVRQLVHAVMGRSRDHEKAATAGTTTTTTTATVTATSDTNDGAAGVDDKEKGKFNGKERRTTATARKRTGGLRGNKIQKQ